MTTSSQIKPFLFLLLCCLLPFQLLAQALLQGRVLDARNRLPLEGVTVTANTGEQTISGREGRYTLTVTEEASTLAFSYLGYSARTIPITHTSEELQVLLQPAAASLSEVVVTGYETNRPLLETAGALSVVESEVIRRFDESSLVRAVNTVPGVRMEERATASYRLSIRGSSLRSPYGIRNVKVYLGEMPLTEANGITNLNLLDAANFSRIEIIKGPTGSIYGAGTGGTILLEPRRAAPGEKTLQLGTTIGSYGLQRYVATASSGSDKGSLLVQYTRQRYGGEPRPAGRDREGAVVGSSFFSSFSSKPTTQKLYFSFYY